METKTHQMIDKDTAGRIIVDQGHLWTWKLRRILECLCITTISHPNILLRAQRFLVKKGLLCKKLLSMHPDHKRQHIQPIPEAGLQKFQRIKNSLIFHGPQHECTTNLSELEIFRNHLWEHSRARNNVPQPGKRILVKGGNMQPFACAFIVTLKKDCWMLSAEADNNSPQVTLGNSRAPWASWLLMPQYCFFRTWRCFGNASLAPSCS
jgi:hypothetical protein